MIHERENCRSDLACDTRFGFKFLSRFAEEMTQCTEAAIVNLSAHESAPSRGRKSKQLRTVCRAFLGCSHLKDVRFSLAGRQLERETEECRNLEEEENRDVASLFQERELRPTNSRLFCGVLLSQALRRARGADHRSQNAKTFFRSRQHEVG